MFEVLLSMVIWGSLGIFVLWSKLPIIDIAFSRCLIGGLLLGAFCFYRGYFKHRFFNLKEVLLVILSGLFLVLNWYLLFESFLLANITIGNVSYYLQPIFLVGLAVCFFREKVSAKQWCYIFLSFLGVILTTDLLHTGVSGHEQLLLGTGCAVLAGLLYAFVSIITKPIKVMPVGMITMIQLFSGVIFILPWMHFHQELHLNGSVIGYVLLIGVVHTALAYILYYNGIKKIQFSVIAILSYVDPVVAVFSDILFFHRHLSLSQIVGLIITLSCSYFVVKISVNARREKVIKDEGNAYPQFLKD